MWKAQIVPFLKGHQLFGFIDGSIPSPTPKINDKINPEYTCWLLQDQLVISAINSFLSNSVLAPVLDCHTSHDVWKTLQDLFQAQSSAHVMHTQLQLATL